MFNLLKLRLGVLEFTTQILVGCASLSAFLLLGSAYLKQGLQLYLREAPFSQTAPGRPLVPKRGTSGIIVRTFFSVALMLPSGAEEAIREDTSAVERLVENLPERCVFSC